MGEKVIAPGVTRTRGPRIRNPVLYPPELRGHKINQLLTVKFFLSRVKLCQLVPMRLAPASLRILNQPFQIARRVLLLGLQEVNIDSHRD